MQRMSELAMRKAELSISVNKFSDSGDARARVVGYDEGKRVLGLSFFRNTNGKTIKLSSNKLFISAHDNGIHYRFVSRVVPTEVLNAAYGISFPEQLEYLQRRNFYRVNVSKESASARLFIPSFKAINADLLDISAKGLRVLTNGAPELDLERGFSIPRIELTLHDLGEAQFSTLVRYFKRAGEGQYIIGMEIEDIANAYSVMIERFIAQRDRELRQKAVGL